MSNEWKDLILLNCDIAIPNISELSDEEFANARRNGIGASDSSVILGTNPWAKLDELREEKLASGYTDRNAQISDKAAVRKGKDLEPLILQKASHQFDIPIFKPVDMYRVRKAPWLTINYDGIGRLWHYWMPFEAKLVTMYGEKQWNPARCWDGTVPKVPLLPKDPVERSKEASEHYGIPPYYYPQLQQQMLGLGSDFGFMAALHDKDWTLRLYMVHRDQPLIDAIIEQSKSFWDSLGK